MPDREKLSLCGEKSFSDLRLCVKLLDLSFQGIEGHIFKILKLALQLAPLILIVGIEADISGEIVDLDMLEIVGLVAIPAKAVRISAMKKIPEIVLLIKRDQVENLIATAGREVQEGLGKGNVHAVAHKEFLNAKIYHGNLIVVLLEELCF